MKRILAAVAGALMMAGTVGAAAQTLGETVAWLEYRCGIHPTVDRNGDAVYYSCTLYDDGHMLVTARWSGSPREIRRYFDIQDVEIGVDDGENTGLGVSFSCAAGSSCIVSFGEGGDPTPRGLAMIPVANYDPAGIYPQPAEDEAASLAQGFLHYQSLVAERNDLF